MALPDTSGLDFHRLNITGGDALNTHGILSAYHTGLAQQRTSIESLFAQLASREKIEADRLASTEKLATQAGETQFDIAKLQAGTQESISELPWTKGMTPYQQSQIGVQSQAAQGPFTYNELQKILDKLIESGQGAESGQVDMSSLLSSLFGGNTPGGSQTSLVGPGHTFQPTTPLNEMPSKTGYDVDQFGNFTGEEDVSFLTF